MTVDLNWADARETHLAVATAIHEISSANRTPEAIWDAPTGDEYSQVEAAVREYVTNGDFPAEEDGRYSWGAETLTIPAA